MEDFLYTPATLSYQFYCEAALKPKMSDPGLQIATIFHPILILIFNSLAADVKPHNHAGTSVLQGESDTASQHALTSIKHVCKHTRACACTHTHAHAP